jgi:hypothetical protein
MGVVLAELELDGIVGEIYNTLMKVTNEANRIRYGLNSKE